LLHRYISPTLRQDYETLLLPCGMIWSFTFYTNYTDPYYIGLDAIEMFDSKGKKIDVLSQATVNTLPPSITELGLSEPNDDRSASNLFKPRSPNSSYMWLSPLCRNTTEEERRLTVRRVQTNSTASTSTDDAYILPKQNVLIVMFDTPVVISVIRYCIVYTVPIL
jgi:Domain of unknown function (DUF4457)